MSISQMTMPVQRQGSAPKGGSAGYKPREPRRKVLIEARMRCGNTWVTVCIRNMSSRGLLAQVPEPPEAGSYVEIRRGPHVIVGRTVWRSGRKFGVRTQDAMNIDAIVSEPVGGTQRPVNLPDGSTIADRRSDRRRLTTEEKQERSRLISSWMQTALLVAAGAGGAIILAHSVFDILRTPLEVITQHL